MNNLPERVFNLHKNKIWDVLEIGRIWTILLENTAEHSKPKQEQGSEISETKLT